MHYNQYVSLCLVMLVLGQAATLPQQPQYPQQLQQRVREDRKFVAKPNATKKVAVKSDPVSSNRIEEVSNSGFSWSNVVGIVKQMLLGKGSPIDPSKNEIESDVPSTWKSMVTIALKIIAAVIGGPRYVNIEGLDKENNENPPQFSSLVLNLLEMLRTSFSQRSLAARSMGRRDAVSEAAAASIAMLKGYMRSVRSLNNNVGQTENEDQRDCTERALCEASAECVADAQGTLSIFCQLGSYATSYLLQKQSRLGFEALYAAGRRGRIGGDCRTLFMSCEAV